MPFIFGIVGLILIVSGLRGTITGSNPNLVSLVKSDLTGTPNYTEWMAAIFIIGALGYIQQLEKISRALMTLVVLGLLFSNKGFFASLKTQLTSTDNNVANPTTATTPNEAAPSFSQTVQNLVSQGTSQSGSAAIATQTNSTAVSPSGQPFFSLDDFNDLQGLE